MSDESVGRRAFNDRMVSISIRFLACFNMISCSVIWLEINRVILEKLVVAILMSANVCMYVCMY